MTERFASAPVARLATVTPEGRPHVVPIVFAVDGDVIYTAVDGKPKSTQRLRRLANIAANPSVSVLVDHYGDDWSQLWWVRADGVASIVADGPEFDRGVRLLRAKYPQYESVSLDGPALVVTVQKWTSWPG
ncbi:TIGR03668 family PPOX class F420-dependent oxidoreductase [Mycobacterium sp. DL592]|uniref:TIGR03668 family PPOX class F420-dependent oxidoreductase n=1 Tax=Mycobacterium sp. DL592 TaxID=2675524 RepID=UPI001421A9C8|nr:TIGR03668 family PPOX class F420-dependent oxidoreductase [Mycobacterium sp. DL592]